MPGKAAKVTITERQQEVLRTIRNAPTAPSRLRQRAAIILLAFEKQGNPEIAAEVGLSRRQVSLWRRRWADAWDRLIRIECLETNAALRRAIEQVLSDEPRPGPPGKFTPEQIVQILAVACEPPEKSGRPDHPLDGPRAGRRGRQAGHRGVDLAGPGGSLSPRGHLAAPQEAVLAQHHREGPAGVSRQAEAVCDTYLEAPALEKDHRTHTVSTDEMTGLQALERNAPSQPMTYGKSERIEFEYTRHGTLTLIGNFQVTTGELIAPTIGPTRTEADFASHIEQTVATDPEASWVFVVDNLNIHCSETLVEAGGQGVRDRAAVGEEGCAGGAEIGGEPAGVLVGAEPPDSVRVHAEAQFVAQPDRGDLRGDHAEGDPAGFVHLGGRPEEQAVELHRLLQSGVCQAVPLDVHRSSAAGQASGVKRGKRTKDGNAVWFMTTQMRIVGLVLQQQEISRPPHDPL